MTYVIMTDVSPKLSRKCRQYLILIKLCQLNVQCVRNSVLDLIRVHICFDDNLPRVASAVATNEWKLAKKQIRVK
jgi:hypothetical protein